MLSEHDQAIVDQLVENFLAWGRAKDQGDARGMDDFLHESRDAIETADDLNGVLTELANRKYDPELRARRLADIDAAERKLN